jgi:CHAT domain-containing protein
MTPDNRKAEAERLAQLGLQQQQSRQFRAALDSWEQALAIYREIGDRQGEGYTLVNLGIAYYSQGQYSKAIDLSQQSLVIARKIFDRFLEGQALGNLGNTYSSLEQYTKAINFYQQRLVIAKEIGDRVGEGIVLGNIGLAYYSLGQYIKAIEFQQQRLILARELDDPEGEGFSLESLGLAYYSLGQYSKAIEFQQQALSLAQKNLDKIGEGNTLGNLGNIYHSLGQYIKAIDFQQQSLSIARELGDRKGEGSILSSMGLAYFFLGQFPKAIDFQQQSLVIAREIGDRRLEGAALGNLGNVYMYSAQYAKAIGFLQQSLVVARETSNRRQEGVVLGGLGNAYSLLEEYTKAIETFNQSITIAKEIGDRSTEGLSLNNLGRTLLKCGKLIDAEKILLTGIHVNESLRKELGGESADGNKISVFEEQARTYRLLQETLVAQGKTNSALEVAERGRANALLDTLSDRFQTSLISKAIRKISSFSEIQQIAKVQNATLVTYSLMYDEVKTRDVIEGRESKLYMWVITPTGEVGFRSVDLTFLWQKQNTSLREIVGESRNEIGARGRASIALQPIQKTTTQQTQTLQKLHQLLIDPIADLLPNDSNDRVIFLPQGALFFAPFAALQDEKGIPLIEKHTISTAPSIQTLDFTQKRRQALKTQKYDLHALVVGNPIMPKVQFIAGDPPQPLSPLPGAEAEAREIAHTLKVQPLIGSKATKATIVPKLSNTQIVHLATHGLLDDVQGLGVPGAIALAPSGQDNGLLTADEIFNLKLNAELVVLSACDTGRGNLTGDGVVGLSRSLIAAGAPSIIVSLWKVPDEPTALLMKEFYRNLQQNPNKAQALRQAMLTTKQKYPAPLNWAAFTLIGEAE